MMRLLLASVFIIGGINLSHANLEVLEIENLNMSYLAPKGEGKIQRFRFGVDTGRTNDKTGELPPFLSEIHVENQSGDLVFESAHSYIIWREAPHFFTNAVKIFSRKLDLYLTYKKTAIKADIVDYDFVDQRYRLSHLDGVCNSQNAGRQIPWRLVENCFNEASLSIALVHFKTVKPSVLDVMMQEYAQELNQELVFTIDTLSELKIDLKQKRLNASARFPQVLDIGFSFSSSLDWNSQSRILIMDVESVKVGFIPVKKIFMKELAKRSFAFMKVEGDRIIINLNQSSEQ